MAKFKELFDQILLYAQQYQAEMSAQLMKMLYMFLLSKSKPLITSKDQKYASPDLKASRPRLNSSENNTSLY